MMKANLITAFAALLVLTPSASVAPVTTPAGVTLAVKIAHVVALPAGQEDVTVPVTLTLANTSDQPVTLRTSNRCQIHIWKATDSNSAVVMNHGICYMIYQPQFDTLAAGDRQTEDESISLQAAKFREGETYTLHYSFWGVFGETKFKVKRAE
jgi:hypothetical protein